MHSGWRGTSTVCGMLIGDLNCRVGVEYGPDGRPGHSDDRRINAAARRLLPLLKAHDVCVLDGASGAMSEQCTYWGNRTSVVDLTVANETASSCSAYVWYTGSPYAGTALGAESRLATMKPTQGAAYTLHTA